MVENVFELFGKIIKKEKLNEDEYTQIPEWIFLHYLSGHNIGAQFAQILNLYPGMPVEAKVKLLESSMPKIGFIRYPKKDKDHDKMIHLISEHFKINYSVAKEYYKIFKTDDIELLEKMYNKGTTKQTQKVKT